MIHFLSQLVIWGGVFLTASASDYEANGGVLWQSEEGLCAKIFKGQEIRPHLIDIANIRINTLKEFPYLYEGSLEQEISYLEMYANSPESQTILLFRTTLNESQIVGFSTSIPLDQEQEEIKKPFQDKFLNLRDFLYIGELIILPPYRKKGILTYFEETKYIENSAKERGFSHIVFMTVKREHSHPCTPKSYRSLESLWKKYGYEKTDGLQVKTSWDQIDTGKNEINGLDIWEKSLKNESLSKEIR